MISAYIPKAGDTCEILYLGKYRNRWLPFRVTAVTNDFVVGYIRNGWESAVNHKDPCVKFRPIKSPHESQREELAALCDEYITRDDYGHNLADAVIKFYEKRYNLEPKQ